MTSPPDEPAPRLAALRYHDFRLLWCGDLVSTVGSQMQSVAVNWHVYRLLKGSVYNLPLWGAHLHLSAGALGLGTLGLVRVLPIIVFGLIGGVVADAHDRRRVIMWTQLGAAFFAAVLAAVTLSGHAGVAALYALTAAGSAVTAFDEPALQSLIPHLVPRRHLANAVSLNTLLWQIGTIVGPAVAGVLVATLNIGVVYALNAVSFLVLLGAVAAMRHRAPVLESTPRPSWSALVEGVRFTYRTRLIWSTMLIDFLATFFSSARTMLPIVADSVLGVGVQGYGVLATAQPLGAVLAGVVLSWRKSIARQGAVLLVSVVVYGLATAFFGLSTVFGLSYVLFALTGAGDTVSTVIRGTIRQMLTPDHLRGRMTSVHMILAMGGPQLGELEAGLVAAVCGVPFSIVTGGVATVVLTAWIAWRSPALRRYRHEPVTDAVVA